MKELKYMPIGRVKVDRNQIWKSKVKAYKTLAVMAFVFGWICGLFIGIYI